jgi:hypothetical protein
MSSVEIEPMPDDTWSALLIIAGPGAAGKSTFLQALRDRRLPSEILSILPESLFSAPYILSKYPRRLIQPPRENIPLRTAVVSAQKQGRILHYALNKLLKDASEHSNESLLLLDFLQSTNETVVVVTIQADRKTLAKQYGKRMLYNRSPGGGAANRLHELKSMFQFLKPTKVVQYFAYRFTQKVPRMYQEWFSLIDRALKRAAANNPMLSCHCIVVEPCLKGASEKSFRILASSPGETSSGVGR